MEQTSTLIADSPKTGSSLCLLALDGGGIRGIVSLLILERLMEAVNPDDPPKPCDYFDMIGGTSTGGLLAIMLGRLRMTIKEAYAEYIRLFPSIFTHLQHRINWKGQTQGRYNSQAIKDGVITILEQRGFGKDELLKDTSPQACKTFVCATSKETSQTVVLSSYYSSRRGSSMRNKAKMWEIVRATSAASSFFDPIAIDGLEFVDGGTGANNPLDELWTEATDTFKSGSQWSLKDNIQCLVSIGTGKPSFTAFNENMRGIIGTLTAIATDTEKVWENFSRRNSDMVQELRLFRFNVDRGLEDIDLDETKSIPKILAATQHYLQIQKTFEELTSCGRNLANRELIQVVFNLTHDYVNSTQSIENTVEQSIYLNKLFESFSNTFAFNSWMADRDAWLLVYQTDSIECSVLFDDVKHDCFGINMASYLSRTTKNASSVFHATCTTQQEPDDTNHSFTDQEILNSLWTAAKSIIAQLLSSEQVQNTFKRLNKTWINDQTLYSIMFCYSENILLHALKYIYELCSYFSEPVTVVFSISWSPEYERAISHSGELLVSSLVESLHHPETCRVLVINSWPVDHGKVVDNNSEYNDCLETLNFDMIDLYLDRIPAAWPGTNQWLWRHSKLQAWRKADSGILWIQGKPGSGKSVLSRTVIERGRYINQLDADNQLMTEDKLWISAHRWVYSRRFEALFMDHCYMLRSLIHQLLVSEKQSFEHVVMFWRRSRLKVRERGFQISELESMLSSLVRNFTRTLLFVVDGFDEGILSVRSTDNLQDLGRRHVLSFLVSLTKESRFIKFILLSRSESDIEEILSESSDCYTIVLQHENARDIRIFIDAQIENLQVTLQRNTTSQGSSSRPGKQIRPAHTSKRVANLIRKGSERVARMTAVDSQTKEDPVDSIRNHLAAHAQGVFLWVSLIFKELQQLAGEGLVSWNQIETVIRGLPTEVVTMYKDIIEGLQMHTQPNRTKKAQKALEWVYAGSEMDGNFTLEVLREALSIPPRNTLSLIEPENDPFSDFRPLESDWLSFRRSLYRLCGPFVDVIRPAGEDPEDFGPLDIVQLIHTTARDFLATSEAGLLQYSTEHTKQNIKHEISRYLTLSFPNWTNDYCPFPARDGSHWEENISSMLEYLEEKPMVAFALQAVPQGREVLPLWTSNLGKAALRQDLVTNLESQHDDDTEIQQLIDYSQAFYQLAYSNMPGKTSVKNMVVSAALGKMFCDGCCQGFETAVANLIALCPHRISPGTSSRGTRSSSPWYEILNGTLIAAICRQQRQFVTQLARDIENHPAVPVRPSIQFRTRATFVMSDMPGTYPKQLLKEAFESPFLALCVWYGTKSICKTLGVYIDVPDRIIQEENYRKWHARVKSCLDPLHMLKYKPLTGDGEGDRPTTQRTIARVVRFYSRPNMDRWRIPFLKIRICYVFRSTLRGARKRNQTYSTHKQEGVEPTFQTRIS